MSLFLCDESKSKTLRAFEAFTYASTLLDIVDAGFDYAQVAKLAQYQDTRKHAAWLGVCTTIALLLELVVKTAMRRKKDKDTILEKPGDSFDVNDKDHRNEYIIFCGAMELAIFLVEDATTVFVWWQTGTYDSESSVSLANLITTVVSAVGALFALLYGFIQRVRDDGCVMQNGKLDSDYLIVGIVAALFVTALAFWAVFALTAIQGGHSYDCIGSCAANANATTLTGSDALVLSGSGSFFGSEDSS